jgi:hypothetical protein
VKTRTIFAVVKETPKGAEIVTWANGEDNAAYAMRALIRRGIVGPYEVIETSQIEVKDVKHYNVG